MTTEIKELLEESATELLKRKGFGLKALMLRYEELRLLAIARGETIEQMWESEYS